MSREEVLRKRNRDGNKVCTMYVVPKSSYTLDFDTCDGSVNCVVKDNRGRTLVTLTMTSSITVLDKGAYNICIEGVGTGTLYSEFTEGGSGDMNCCEEMRQADAEIRTEINNVSSQLRTLETKVNKIIDGTTSTGCCNDLDGEIEALKQRVRVLEDAASSGDPSCCEELRAEIAPIKNRLTTVENDITSLKARMSNTENNISDVTDRVNGAETEIDSLETRVGSAENNINNLDTRVGNTEDDVDSVESRLSIVESNINNLNVVGGTGISVSKSGHVFTVTNTSPGTSGGGGTTDCCDELRAKDAELTANINALTNRINDQNIIGGNGISVTKSGDNYTITNSRNDTNTVTTLTAGSGISIADNGTGENHAYAITNALNIQQGTNVQVTKSGNNVTVSATDTKPDVNKAYVDAQITSLNDRVEVIDAYRLPNPVWVSPSGNDSTGDGTQSKPFRQIKTAANKIPFNKSYTVNVLGGTYENFLVGYCRNITFVIHGNITLTASDLDIPNIWVASGCYVIFRSNNTSTVRNINITESNANTQIYCRLSSNIEFDQSVKIMFNNFTNTSSNLITSALSSTILFNCDIGYTGTFTPNCIFLANNGGNIIWVPPTTGSSNIQSPSSTIAYFGISIRSSLLNIEAPNITINNKFNVGIRGLGGAAFVNVLANNATTPIQQLRGGRVFTAQNLASTNAINPLESTMSDVVEDSFPMEFGNYPELHM